MKTTLFTLGAFASVASAHFKLDYPPARGFNEDNLVNFPCGGFDTPSTTRTPWPLKNGSIALDMGHINANIEVLLGLGDNPGVAYNTVIKQTFQETGLGNFCLTGLTIPDGVNVTAGMNATIQVVTNGDPDGGLYNCADITFVETADAPSCTDGKGVSAGAEVKGNPNGTTSAEPSSTSAGAAATSSKAGAAAGLKAGMGGLLVAGLAAGAMVL